MSRKGVKWLVLLCYLLGFLVWLGHAIFVLFYEAALSPLILDTEAAQLQEVQPYGANGFSVEGGDGQLRFEGLDIYAGRLWLLGEFSEEPVELDLYYKKPGQTEYSVKQRVFARPLEGGGYEYRLPAGHYTGLRLDTGTQPGNKLAVRALVLNPPAPWYAAFALSPRSLAALLVLPALASCAIYTIMELYLYAKKRWAKPPARRVKHGR